jgi:hypothetical protein
MKQLNGHGRDLRNEGFHTAPPWQCALSVSLPRLAAQIAKSTDHSVSIDTSLSLEGPCRTCPSGWVALAPHDRAARLYSCPIHGDHVAGSPADRQSYCRVTRTARHTVIVTARNASAKAPVWSRFCLRRAVAVSMFRALPHRRQTLRRLLDRQLIFSGGACVVRSGDQIGEPFVAPSLLTSPASA